MNQFFSNKKVISLLIAVISIASLYAVSSRYEQSFATSVINDAVAFPGRAVTYPGNALRDLTNSVKNLFNTYNENKHLKKKVESVYELEVKVAELQKDNEAMKNQLGLVDSLNQYGLVNATVIARNPDNWLQQLVINKGKSDGIERDMVVMSGNGLIGKIVEVNNKSSKVALLSNTENSQTRVAALVQVDGDSVYGTVTSNPDDANYLLMNQIDPEADLKIGDKVITSGLGGAAPRGLFIGTVDDIHFDRYGLFKEARIKHAANMNDIRYVTVVRRASGSGGE
ncbi:rod shape-determining protein MreC [Atopobacter sp. AH10]|uniref:rod shape-determining protein MreC n=1 Tax=Atopobacter sp. AH10 TaxID=2315861 RepID=UPI000EF26AA7|nr:rod shape-determining protein MreC [Atopobacter sp. AH10]RLK62971.1 rod shape-determining protein MreC [Atopobacter sp. AH10]